MITRKIKDIDTLIDSLPSEDSTKRLQDAALESMNAGLKQNVDLKHFIVYFWIKILGKAWVNCILSLENEKQGDELQRFVNEADQLLSQISDTLADIADTQLDARRVSFILWY